MGILDRIAGGADRIEGHTFSGAVMVWFELADGASADAMRARIADWFALDVDELVVLDRFRGRFQELSAAEARIFAWRVHTAVMLRALRRYNPTSGLLETFFDNGDVSSFLGL